MKINRHIPKLIAKHIKGKLSDQEYQELEDWVTASEENMQLFLRLTDKAFADKELKQFQAIEADPDTEWKKVLGKHKQRISQRAIIRMIKFAAAAVFIGFLGIQGIKLLIRETNQTTPTFAKLDSVTNAIGSHSRHLKLPDGSGVWLSASSGISYPASFDKNKRVVNIYGKVYFEVNHLEAANGAKIPFVVNVPDRGVNINVTGTSFNVEDYKEQELKTTLLQGSIKMIAGADSCKLEPGQQATLRSGSFVIDNVATGATVAWKDGFFQFDRATIKEVMDELCRSYNVTVDYKINEFPKRVSIQPVSRDIALGELLKGLEPTAELHFSFDKSQGKIFVMR